MNKDKVLCIVRGLPGSGKSTAAEILAQASAGYEGDWTVATADDFFMKKGVYKWNPKQIGIAHKWCQDKVRKAMAAGDAKVFVANTNTTQKELNDYYKIAKEFDYSVISMIVENRHEGVNVHNVPQEALDRMKERFDVKL
jgi:predicted kinase